MKFIKPNMYRFVQLSFAIFENHLVTVELLISGKNATSDFHKPLLKSTLHH